MFGNIDLQRPVDYKHPLNRKSLILWRVPLPGDLGNTPRDLFGNYQSTVEGTPSLELSRGGIPALKLNGSTDYINYGDILKTPQPMTISVAFKIDSFSILWEFLCGKGGSTFRIQRATDNSFLEAAFADGFFTPGTWCWSSTPIDDGQWHVVTAIFVPSTKIKIYIDGNLENETAPAISWPGTSDKPFTVGYNDSDLRWWGGSVSWWSVYGEELSDDEVWELYQQSLNGFPDMLKRNVPFVWAFPVATVPATVQALPLMTFWNTPAATPSGGATTRARNLNVQQILSTTKTSAGAEVPALHTMSVGFSSQEIVSITAGVTIEPNSIGFGFQVPATTQQCAANVDTITIPNAFGASVVDVVAGEGDSVDSLALFVGWMTQPVASVVAGSVAQAKTLLLGELHQRTVQSAGAEVDTKGLFNSVSIRLPTISGGASVEAKTLSVGDLPTQVEISAGASVESLSLWEVTDNKPVDVSAGATADVTSLLIADTLQESTQSAGSVVEQENLSLGWAPLQEPVVATNDVDVYPLSQFMFWFVPIVEVFAPYYHFRMIGSDNTDFAFNGMNNTQNGLSGSDMTDAAWSSAIESPAMNASVANNSNASGSVANGFVMSGSERTRIALSGSE